MPCRVLRRSQVDKVLQLHLACEQRIGVIIVGPSGSGKSTLWEMLEKVRGAAVADKGERREGRESEGTGKRPVACALNVKGQRILTSKSSGKPCQLSYQL